MYRYNNRLVFGVWLLLVAGTAQAEIYKWVDENGEVHFGDRESMEHSSERIEVKINTYESVTVSSSSSTAISRAEVVLYSTQWCPVCKKARAYLRDNKIPFKEYDVETSAKGRSDYEKLKGNGVPIILVGDRRMDGFSASAFAALYENKK